MKNNTEGKDLENTGERRPEIGYILRTFGRSSESFIANEIYLLESLGAKLSIFSVNRLKTPLRQGIYTRLKSPVSYLPDAVPEEKMSFLKTFFASMITYVRAHLWILSVYPMNYLRTLIEVVVFCFRYGPRRFVPRRIFLREFVNAGYIAAEVLKQGNIKHLHSHFSHNATTIAMFASQLSGIPYSFTAHAQDIYLEELNPGDLLSIKTERAKFVVASSEGEYRYLESISGSETPLHLIYHGLDASYFVKTAELPPRDPQSKPLILSVGRMIEKNGFEYLIKACSQLRLQGKSFKCLIVGSPDANFQRIKGMIQELKLEGVVSLRSSITPQELRQLYQQANIFALPCVVGENGERDGIPVQMIEAMAMRVPIVSTYISGITELIQSGIDGWLVPSKDEIRLAEALGELLDDPKLRQRLAEAARMRAVRYFDATRNVGVLKNLFIESLRSQIQPSYGLADMQVDQSMRTEATAR